MTIPPPPPGNVPPETLAQWRTAEERLYPVVMLRPDLYQRSVQLVRAVADELSTCGDIPALVAAWRQAAEIVYRVSSDQLLPLADLDAGLIAGAAFSLRYRELAGSAAREDRLERIRETAAAGGGWVVVERIGSPEMAAMVPYTWVEMHVPTGAGLRQTIEAEPDSGAPVFRLQVVRCDPDTGECLTVDDDLVVEETFSVRGEWEEAVAAHRREIEGSV